MSQRALFLSQLDVQLGLGNSPDPGRNSKRDCRMSIHSSTRSETLSSRPLPNLLQGVKFHPSSIVKGPVPQAGVVPCCRVLGFSQRNGLGAIFLGISEKLTELLE